MPVLDRDPFRLLGIPRTAGLEEAQRAAGNRTDPSGERDLLLHAEGLRLARLATPVADRDFTELTAALPPRPRYIGPGAWKKALKKILAEQESRG